MGITDHEKINSGNVLWRHSTESTLFQVMACCRTAWRRHCITLPKVHFTLVWICVIDLLFPIKGFTIILLKSWQHLPWAISYSDSDSSRCAGNYWMTHQTYHTAIVYPKETVREFPCHDVVVKYALDALYFIVVMTQSWRVWPKLSIAKLQ